MEINNSTDADNVSLSVQHRNVLLYWNGLTSEYLLPNTIILIVYLMVGIIGNVTVILIYQIQMRKKQMDGRYFVAPLAWLDLIALIVTGTLNLTRNTRSVIFPKLGACKMLTYFSYVTTSSSLYLLAVIALQRYLKICRPFGRQMNLCWKRISVCLCIVIPMITNIPIPIYYGIVTVQNSALGNVTGYQCTVLSASPNRLQSLRIFQGFGIVGILSVVLLASILYCFVTMTIVKQMRKHKKLPVKPEDFSVIKPDLHTTDMTVLSNSSLQSDTNSDLDTISTNTAKSPKIGKKQIPTKQNMPLTFRISFMFLTIFMVGLVAYLPSWIFIFIETNNPTFWKTLPTTTFHVCLTLRRMYMINHIANPFICGIFDKAFKQEISKSCCRNCQNWKQI